MKTDTLLAIALIVMGIVVFTYQGIAYTTREKVVDIGPIRITSEKNHASPMPSIMGGIVLATGIVWLVGNAKRA